MNGSKLMPEPVRVPDRSLAQELIRFIPERVGKNQFHAGISSRSRVLTEFGASSDEIDFFLADGACVDVFHILNGSGDISAKIRYHLKKHASLNVWVFYEAGQNVLFDQEVIFEEEHGFASFRGLSLAGDSSQVTHRVTANHRVGHCISRQFFKTIASGRAKSVFESLVAVAKNSPGSDSKQLNKNLLLSKQAQCHSRPELRIGTDDVSAVHGSATGELNPAELFYMRSRGISEEAARLMMIEGFAAEIVEEVPYEPLRREWKQKVRQKTAKLWTA